MNLDDLNKALDSSDSEETNVFLKQEGDMVAGTILKIGEFKHADYAPAPTLSLQTDDGTVVSDGEAIPQAGVGRVLMLGKLLGDFFREEGLQVGDWVAFKHQGKKKSPSSGYSYNSFGMIMERPSRLQVLEEAQSNF